MSEVKQLPLLDKIRSDSSAQASSPSRRPSQAKPGQPGRPRPIKSLLAQIPQSATCSLFTAKTQYVYLYICTAWQIQASHALDRLKWSP